jgi:thymidylate kinase
MNKRPTSNPSEQQALMWFFEFLNARQINYVVVGDATNLPYQIGSDIDIVVDSYALRHLSLQLKAFAEPHGFSIVQQLQHESCAYYTCLTWGDGLKSLKLDVSSDYLRGGRMLIRSTVLLKDRKRHVYNQSGGYFFVPSTAGSFAYYLAKRADKLALTVDSMLYLRGLWSVDRASAMEGFLSIWSQKDLPALESVLSKEDPAGLAHLRAELRCGRPVRIHDLAREAWRRMRRANTPTGLFVAVMGPDGAGKSTLIAALQDQLLFAFRGYRYQHLRPGCLPGSRAGGQEVTQPHSRPAYGVARSLMKLVYLYIDYLVGFAFKVWPALVRSTFYVSDRYYHDLTVDPARYRYGASLGVARWLGRLMPRPDLVFVLDAPANVVLSRKREVTPAECERQASAYRELTQYGAHVRLIDAARPPEEVARNVRLIIIQHLQQRTERRLV